MSSNDTFLAVFLGSKDNAKWAAWNALSPAERFLESMKLWESYLEMGGSLEPEPDTQSPFFDPDEWRENAPHGRPGLRVLRRGRV